MDIQDLIRIPSVISRFRRDIALASHDFEIRQFTFVAGVYIPSLALGLCSSSPSSFPLSSTLMMLFKLVVVIHMLSGVALSLRNSQFDVQTIFETPPNDGIHLAVGPRCTSLLDKVVGDVNAGIDITSVKTLITFGVRLSMLSTPACHDILYHRTHTPTEESTTAPLSSLQLSCLPIPKLEVAQRTGAYGLKILQSQLIMLLSWTTRYARFIHISLVWHAERWKQWGACTNLSLWPSNPRKVDLAGQTSTFLSQNNTLHPETSLYALFFGIKFVVLLFSFRPSFANTFSRIVTTLPP